VEYGKKVSKLRENRKVACRKVKNRACSTDSDSGQKCETFPEFPHMSADEYQNAKITFLNDFSRVNIFDISKTKISRAKQSFRLTASKFALY
jgi:hypothetical protein